MKRFLFVSVMLSLALPALAQVQYPRPSPNASVSQTVGLTEVEIVYSRPSKRGRQIFGGLVPYGRVWRTGANEPTVIRFSDEVTVNGQPLAAGSYSIHTIPGEEQWTLIFNRNADRSGGYSYDVAQDALRIDVRPRQSDHPHEVMTFAFPRVTSDSAEVVLAWDGLMVPFTIGTDTSARVLRSIRSALDWRIPFQAANWAHENRVAGADAMSWIDRSIALEPTWPNLRLKARMLAAEGRNREAVTAGERAVRTAKAMSNPPDTRSFEAEIAEWKRTL